MAATGELTRYGFRWGPATVSRACEHKGHVVLMIRGARQEVMVRVTPSGLIRVDKIRPAPPQAEAGS